jgi:phage-related protein
MTFTTAQLEDAQQLTGDAYVDLFEITLTNATKVYLSPGKEYTWQAHSYEYIPCKLDTVERNGGDEINRPKFTLANPDGAFTSLVGQGLIDNALLTRRRLLLADLLANSNTAISNVWKIKRVVSVTRDTVTLELRDQLDGQFFLTPGRMFIPPEFAQVRLQ